MSFQELISDLRKAESQLVRQLGGIRQAISSLEMGSAVSPSIPHRGPRRPARRTALTQSVSVQECQQQRGKQSAFG